MLHSSIGVIIQESVINPTDFLQEEDIKVDFKKIDKEQYDDIVKRKEEYRSGIEYLMNNGLTEEHENLTKKMNGFKNCLSILERGSKVPIEKIPPKLTPELLLNTTAEKRNESFQELLKSLIREKLFIQNQVKNKKQKDKTALAKSIKREQEINNWLITIKNLQRNMWVPCPLYHEETNLIEVQIVQKDIKEGEILIDYLPNPNMAQNNCYIIYYELKGDSGILQGQFQGSNNNRVRLQLPDGCKNIHEYDLSIKLHEKQCAFCNPLRGKIDSKLLALEDACNAELKSTEGAASFKVVVRIRAPCNGANTEYKEMKEVVIDRMYPAFRGGAAPALQPKPAPVSTLPRKQTNVPNAGGTQLVKKKTLASDPPLPKVLENLPSGVNEKDIRDPDNVDNLVCASYLEKRISFLNARIKQVSENGGKIPDAIKSTVNLMVRNNTILQGSIESGKLSPEQYKEFLGRQLEKDKAALVYLEKYKQNTKAAIVKERIECITKELTSFS